MKEIEMQYSRRSFKNSDHTWWKKHGESKKEKIDKKKVENFLFLALPYLIFIWYKIVIYFYLNLTQMEMKENKQN